MLRRRGGGPAARLAAGLACAIATGLTLASCATAPEAPAVTDSVLGHQPNIVFVLTDDLSRDLVRYMPHVLALEKAGTTFTNYTVTDSLCCPSRSSILTGEFPHDTGIFTNTGIDGGFLLFHRRGEEQHTFANTLQSVGYRTALLGKYLNGYRPSVQYSDDGDPQPGHSKNWVAPGWNTWAVAGNGYPEFGYKLNENHKVVKYGDRPKDYLTDVLSGIGQKFVTQSAHAKKPFLLELATFAPHLPYTPAPRDSHSFPGLQAPRGPAWDRIPLHAPAWLAKHPKLTPSDIRSLDSAFRKRVQAVQAVDRAIGELETTLKRTGQASNTVFVFSSDNGLHLGQYGLDAGKLTAFDTDIEVPLVIVGPHIPAGRVDRSVVQNIDLAPTFESIAGAQVPGNVDGHSMVGLLAGEHPRWRSAALVEHHGPDFDPSDPDIQDRDAGNPPTYDAIRTATYTYVRYDDGEREYYDRTTDPNELDNIFGSLSAARVSALDHQVDLLTNCHGGAECWDAGQARHTA